MYGLCLLLGIFLATSVGERLCKKHGLDTAVFWRAVFYALLFGLLGARLYHVLHRFDYFFQRPLEIFAVWQGGLGIWGAVLGGILGFFLSIRKTGKALAYLDIFAVSVPLAQAVGRWGNYFNRELFGLPTALPWGVYIPSELRPDAFKYYDHFHPLFLYESILDLALFVFLYKLFKRSLTPGAITFLYLAGYSLIRFPLEFLRISPWSIFGFPVAGLASAVIFSLSVILLVRFKCGNVASTLRKKQKYGLLDK